MILKGIPITLYETTETGKDTLNRPLRTTEAVTVENVLVQPLSEQEIRDTLDLTGRRAVYRLCLPKGDSHAWTDCRVEFFGSPWRVIGDAMEWIESMVPLEWNKQIRVERIDG